MIEYVIWFTAGIALCCVAEGAENYIRLRRAYKLTLKEQELAAYAALYPMGLYPELWEETEYLFDLTAEEFHKIVDSRKIRFARHTSEPPLPPT